jgi:hypothetical protein
VILKFIKLQLPTFKKPNLKFYQLNYTFYNYKNIIFAFGTYPLYYFNVFNYIGSSSNIHRTSHNELQDVEKSMHTCLHLGYDREIVFLPFTQENKWTGVGRVKESFYKIYLLF